MVRNRPSLHFCAAVIDVPDFQCLTSHLQNCETLQLSNSQAGWNAPCKDGLQSELMLSSTQFPLKLDLFGVFMDSQCTSTSTGHSQKAAGGIFFFLKVGNGVIFILPLHVPQIVPCAPLIWTTGFLSDTNLRDSLIANKFPRVFDKTIGWQHPGINSLCVSQIFLLNNLFSLCYTVNLNCHH